MEDKKKPTFKEIHGKTKLGLFLQKTGPKLLKTILGVAGGLVPGASGVTDAIGSLIRSSDELDLEQKSKALDLLKMDMQDLADARDMYKSTDHTMADKVAERVINYNLWVVMAALIIEIICVIVIDDKVLIAIISGAVGSITTALLQERQQVINFFFGSSQGSKDKSIHLNGPR